MVEVLRLPFNRFPRAAEHIKDAIVNEKNWNVWLKDKYAILKFKLITEREPLNMLLLCFCIVENQKGEINEKILA